MLNSSNSIMTILNPISSGPLKLSIQPKATPCSPPPPSVSFFPTILYCKSRGFSGVKNKQLIWAKSNGILFKIRLFNLFELGICGSVWQAKKIEHNFYYYLIRIRLVRNEPDSVTKFLPLYSYSIILFIWTPFILN